MSISEYLSRSRIDMAKLILRDSRTPVLEISERLGFSSVSHFNRLFKEIVGVTPTEYRKENAAKTAK
jgi:AraC-like DNA-binding protein